MKIFKSVLVLSALLTMLVACGGDSSSSSVSPDPRSCEDQNEDCDDTSSSSGEVSKNSSSSQMNSNKEKSSSSVEKSKSSSSSVIPASSGDLQSSSSKDSKNSSSSEDKAKESSSSVKPTSSSDAKSSSSKETKTSSSASSSSAKSSSSFDINAPCTEGDFKRYLGVVYECVGGTWTKYDYSSSSAVKSSSSIRGYEALPYVPFNSSLSYGEFTDTRDGTKYATIDIDNKFGPDSVRLAFTVFAQNLKYHDKMVLGSEEQDDDTKVEMYCYNDSIEYCNDWWGGLYQWAEMMALPYECNNKSCADLIDPDGDDFHQGICPDGWHVMTLKEMLAASYTTGGDTYLETRMSTIASEISYSNGFGYNTSGMSFLAAGCRDDEKVFGYLHEFGMFEYPEEYPGYNDRSLGGGVSKNSYFNDANKKINGASVRCVKDY